MCVPKDQLEIDLPRLRELAKILAQNLVKRLMLPGINTAKVVPSFAEVVVAVPVGYSRIGGAQPL